MGASNPVKHRRRGADLEHAILEDAWVELVEHGYTRLTMEAVASRAGTSRSVLARRWDSKISLAISAIRQQAAKYPLDVADCGDLRTELLDFLDRAADRSPIIPVIFSLLSSEYFQDTFSSPQELRNALTEGGNNTLAAILDRAVDRGEIDPQKLIPSVETLLGDLFRYHVIMTLSVPSSDLRKTWVDAIFMPLVRAD